MSRWKSVALGALVLVLAGLSMPAPAGAQHANEQIMAVRSTYHHVNSAIHNTLESQVNYSIARASEDETGMRQAAAGMLVSLAETRFWLAVLDVEVTASEFGDNIDKQIADLSALAVQAFDTIGVAILSNDLTALNARLDESANTFNRLALDLDQLRTGLGPKLTAP